VAKFPKPLEFALETYYKIAMLYKSNNDMSAYHRTLKDIISRDAHAGSERTDRTRYLAAESSLVLIEPRFDAFVAMKLSNPLKRSMQRKQSAMKSLINSYTRLVDYKVADVTAASTYYLAEIYYNFDQSLLHSEVPKGLSPVELEEFKLALEDQAYPFEEKAIKVHEKNVELLKLGVYSKWIDRSIAKLAKLVPARFDKSEDVLPYIADLKQYRYTPPGLVREDAPTIYVENLKIFRYPSQKIDAFSTKKPAAAETSKGTPESGGIAPAQKKTEQKQGDNVNAAGTAESAGTQGKESAPKLGPPAADTQDTAPQQDSAETAGTQGKESAPKLGPPAADTQDAAPAGEPGATAQEQNKDGTDQGSPGATDGTDPSGVETQEQQ
jgi:hypothetical protein